LTKSIFRNSISSLQIPEESTDFIYGEKTIPVYIEQLYGIPIDQGTFGKVCAVDIEGSPAIRIAVKVRSFYG
jgi:hypothetical protein